MPTVVASTTTYVPHPGWTWPFVLLLLTIAIFPLIPALHRWWEHNRNKLLVAAVLGVVTIGYYGLRGMGYPVHETNVPAEQSAAQGAAHRESIHAASTEAVSPHRTAAGLRAVKAMLGHAVLAEYIPFIVLLFSLYVISGGIVVRGDIRATPAANTAILAIGSLLASVIGTTGAAMVLIRLVLKTNAERRHKVHTVVFFIFLVANAGGCLLPIGDPPLFLGYLMGVDFFWTLRLWREWAFIVGVLLAIYYVWDTLACRSETPEAMWLDRMLLEPVQLHGLVNLAWLAGVVLAVATLDPLKPFPGTSWHAFPYLREGVQIAMAGLSVLTTSRELRYENRFNYTAIAEVACLFIGIFVTMQVPIEILQARGPELGLAQPWHFFWASGALSSFLDNAPTYVVFFATAGSLHASGGAVVAPVATASGQICTDLLVAISCGSVFMGANTYIGNGPNFMVKTIAEQSGVKMPSFFGYMLYSMLILVPVFVALTFVFMVG